MTLKLTGVTHKNRQDIIKTLKVGDKLHFRADTNNPHDTYAVSVLTEDGRSVGFVARGQNQEIHKNLLAGNSYTVSVAAITGGKNGIYYGINIKAESRGKEIDRTADISNPETTETDSPEYEYKPPLSYTPPHFLSEEEIVNSIDFNSPAYFSFYCSHCENMSIENKDVMKKLRVGQRLWFKRELLSDKKLVMILDQNGNYLGNIGGVYGENLYRKLSEGRQFDVEVTKNELAMNRYQLFLDTEITLKITFAKGNIQMSKAVQKYDSHFLKFDLKESIPLFIAPL